MWVLPNNYQLSSAFAQGMVESKEDLTLLESSIQSSLMWRSKPSPLRTWLLRWKKVSWMQPLFTRILKPSHQKSFEAQLTSSLEATRVSRSQWRETEKEQMTQDTFGRSSDNTSMQLNLLGSSLKMSTDTHRLDCPQSLAIWKKMVTQELGEYSQRKKLAHPTKGSESISWPTPAAHEARLGYQDRSTGKKGTQESLTTVVMNRMGGRDAVSGQLNPEWVEWLMGVPTGWTELGCWGTE